MPPEVTTDAELPRLILASASPRRRELLALLGLPFTVVPSRYEEPSAPAHPVSLADFVRTLATEKAKEVAARSPACWVLGADTEVALEAMGTPLGKPADAADAARMLRLLAGRTHLVATGIALIYVHDDGRMEPPVATSVQTAVRFRPLTEAMIADYVATGEPLDKAGAYGAQGYAAPFIESIESDFFNVMGLPICAVGKLLEEQGVLWWQHRKRLPALPE